MKIVYSYVYNRIQARKVHQYLEMAALSNFLVKKHHPDVETIFLGDDEAIKNFKKIGYDHIERLPEYPLKNLPNELWTMGKLCAMLEINEPFIHMDFDMLLFKPLDKSIFEKDVLAFHREQFVDWQYINIQNILNIKPKECGDIPVQPYNCGMFGGKSFKEIKFAIETVLNFTIDNSSYLKEVYYKNKEIFYFFDITVLIEQVWIFQILKVLNQSVHPIVKIDNWYKSYDEMMEETGYVHLLSDRKAVYHDRIKNIVNQLNIKY